MNYDFFGAFLKRINFKDTSLIFKNSIKSEILKIHYVFCQQERVGWKEFGLDRRVRDSLGNRAMEFWKCKLGLKTYAFFFPNTAG